MSPAAGPLGIIAFLAVLGGGTVFFARTILRRYQQVTQAKRPDVRWDNVPARLKNVMVFVMGQKRLPKNGYHVSGILHMMIFGAFIVLGLDTTNFIVSGLFNGGDAFDILPNAYLGLADTFRFLCILALSIAIIRRQFMAPSRFPAKYSHAYWDAMFTVFFIMGLMVFETLQEGFHGAYTGHTGHTAPLNWWTNIFAGLFTGIDQGTLKWGYQLSWWAHLINLVWFVNYVPLSKHSHVFGAPLNIFFLPIDELEPKGALRKMNFEFEDGEEPDYFGARTLEDLSWKQVFDGLACTQCGRCTDNCPASLSDKPLRPMDIIVELKVHAEKRFAMSGEQDLEGNADLHLVGGVFDPDVLWSCTTCRACMEVCPVGNEHIPAIIDMRRYMTMTDGKVGHGAAGALKNMNRKGDPWGMGKKDRMAWADGMDVPLWDKKNPAEYLLWVGCAGAFDPNGQKTTQAMVRLLRQAGIDFAVLGKKEKCTGDSARRLGDEYLYQELAEYNVKNFERGGVKKIITQCPHCFNTIKNEYPQFGGNYDVVHHSEMLAELVQEGKLKPEANADAAKRIVYHDSCYLGRYNDLYDPQRELIKALPGTELLEADRNRETGLCCGAGGGHMWMEMDIGERINFVRTDDLLKQKPDAIAVACNFCLTMVDEGVKARGKEDDVKIIDLANLLDARITYDQTEEDAEA